MSETVWNDLVAAIHASTCKTVMAVTGGGSRLVSQLLEVPGASKTLLEAVVPYSSSALTEWLGGAPTQSCCVATARAMAMSSWMKARRLAPDEDPYSLIGLGGTASLVSNRRKKGTHRVHIAIQTASSTSTLSLEFRKGARERKKEEWLCAKLLLIALARACGVQTSHAEEVVDRHLFEAETPVVVRQEAEPAWTELLFGSREYTALPCPLEEKYSTVFPGSFNPPHEGHKQIAEVASRRTGSEVVYELSITNVEKPPLDFIDIQQRYDLLRESNGAKLLLTNAPTFRKKALLFPGCTFVVGADTMSRIGDVRYYDGEPAAHEAAIQLLAQQECRFLVFGREIDGRFQVLDNLTLPPQLRELCEEVAAEDFRQDVSSTDLRELEE